MATRAESMARYMWEARGKRQRYENLPDALAPASIDEAYAAQEALCALWKPRLGAIAGRKIAITTKVMQELMGIDHPCGGLIFASRVHRSPARIRLRAIHTVQSSGFRFCSRRRLKSALTSRV